MCGVVGGRMSFGDDDVFGLVVGNADAVSQYGIDPGAAPGGMSFHGDGFSRYEPHGHQTFARGVVSFDAPDDAGFSGFEIGKGEVLLIRKRMFHG